MILKKKVLNESGYLLIESLVALSILSVIILTLYPLVVDWLVLVETEKEQVELSRALYESSYDWPSPPETKGYTVKRNNRSLIISSLKNSVDVHIYEVDFKK